jgi:hypothetical protein
MADAVVPCAYLSSSRSDLPSASADAGTLRRCTHAMTSSCAVRIVELVSGGVCFRLNQIANARIHFRQGLFECTHDRALPCAPCGRMAVRIVLVQD